MEENSADITIGMKKPHIKYNYTIRDILNNSQLPLGGVSIPNLYLFLLDNEILDTIEYNFDGESGIAKILAKDENNKLFSAEHQKEQLKLNSGKSNESFGIDSKTLVNLKFGGQDSAYPLQFMNMYSDVKGKINLAFISEKDEERILYNNSFTHTSKNMDLELKILSGNGGTFPNETTEKISYDH